MKQYKVGDTIYVKGKIVEIDHDDTDLPYCVNVGPINGIWPDRSDIIDELPTAEPVKPVLPKAVADELTKYQARGHDFDSYITKIADNYNWDVTMRSQEYFHKHYNAARTLCNAWYNGYTVEKEPRYKVYVTGTNKQFMYLKRGGWANVDNKKATPITPQSINNYLTAGGNRDLYWFTDEEITKFDLQDCDKEPVADDNED